MRTTKAQAVHPHSLISTVVVHCSIDSIIPIFAKSKISRLCLVSVAEQAGLCLTWSQSWQKTGFLLCGSMVSGSNPAGDEILPEPTYYVFFFHRALYNPYVALTEEIHILNKNRNFIYVLLQILAKSGRALLSYIATRVRPVLVKIWTF